MHLRISKMKIDSKKTIGDAIKLINLNAKGVCFVTSKGKLNGILTDGDIRRVLIHKSTTDTRIDKILKKNYKSLPINSPSSLIKKHLSTKIKFIPLVDQNNKLVDYASLDEFRSISIAKPELRGNEIKYLTDCVNSGWVSSVGPYISKFEKIFSKYTKLKNVIAVSSGTTALQLALSTLNIGQNDEVIVPDLTFASPVNAIIHTGAKPVLAEVKKNTYCIDEQKIEKLITKKTKAIVVVHLYGHPAQIKDILKITKKYGIYLIEDCAEALGSYYNGKHVGCFGDISTFSFFANKTITTGEGGMISFKKRENFQRGKILRDHGMSRDKKYWHIYPGFNFRMTNLQAAVGLAQMERIGWFIKKKRKLVNLYNKHLANIDFIDLPGEYGNVINSYWLYTINLKKGFTRYKNELIRKMNLNGIEARPVFYSMHLMPIYKKYVKKNYSLLNSKALSNAGISLPSAYDISEKDIIRIKIFLQNFKKNIQI